jgi:hypothetical protein
LAIEKLSRKVVVAFLTQFQQLQTQFPKLLEQTVAVVAH